MPLHPLLQGMLGGNAPPATSLPGASAAFPAVPGTVPAVTPGNAAAAVAQLYTAQMALLGAAGLPMPVLPGSVPLAGAIPGFNVHAAMPSEEKKLSKEEEWERTKNLTRIAPDGKKYTKAEFVAHYGGLREWEEAEPDPDCPEPPPQSEKADENPAHQGGVIPKDQLPSWANEGDWRCPDPKCANINYARRDKCNRCGEKNPTLREKGGGSGRRPNDDSVDDKGMLKPKMPSVANGDWACGMCGNINWERREKCNICQGPKPGALVEERTGAAGGFFERNDPKDKIQREESDEEYDDFGRKKKKKKLNSQKKSQYSRSDPSDLW